MFGNVFRSSLNIFIIKILEIMIYNLIFQKLREIRAVGFERINILNFPNFYSLKTFSQVINIFIPPQPNTWSIYIYKITTED
ncbi:MAG: hypothetical protein CBE41_00445 [Gammaproteobacteria bacterium TMED281]|nr:MAG: hypothetical protein CBE41_00445 [Gammaproteobacteria bacterium TMED281]